LLIKINFRLDSGQGTKIFLKMTLFNSNKISKIELKSVICPGPDPGPKSHEISLMILHQIFLKSSEDLQVRGRAYRGCDLSKISTIFLLKIIRRSQRDFFKDPRIIFNKNFVEIFGRILWIEIFGQFFF
jgi:hypothetical protein